MKYDDSIARVAVIGARLSVGAGSTALGAGTWRG